MFNQIRAPLPRNPESESLLARCFAEFGASLGAASFLHQSSCCGLPFLHVFAHINSYRPSQHAEALDRVLTCADYARPFRNLYLNFLRPRIERQDFQPLFIHWKDLLGLLGVHGKQFKADALVLFLEKLAALQYIYFLSSCTFCKFYFIHIFRL